MKPQNAAERGRAFTRFILFYVITTALIVGAVYFGVQVPFRQNAQLQAQLDVVQQEKDFNLRFADLMRRTKALIDTVNNAGPNIEVIDKKIADNIVELEKMLSHDSVSNKQLYDQVLQSLTDAKNDKKTIRASDKSEAVAEYERTKIDLEKKLADYENRYRDLNTYYQECLSRR